MTEISNKVMELVHKALDEKLQVGGGSEKYLRQAYELVVDNCVGEPWEGIVAYRLGHCLLRKKDQNPEELLEYFDIATNDSLLKPKALLYALAVKIRCGRDIEQEEFEIVVGEVRRGLSDSEIARMWHRDLQDPVSNYLELLCYTGGFDYDSLAGLNLSSQADLLAGAEHYRVLGSNDEGQYNYNKMHAVQIAESLRLEDNNAIVCVWEGSKYECRFKDKVEQLEQDAPSALLTTIVNGGFEPVNPADPLRTTKKDLNKFIKSLCEKNLTARGLYSVVADCPCYVVVPQKTIAEHRAETENRT